MAATTEKVTDYYKRVEKYHQIAEESHGSRVVPPELILRYLDTSRFILDVAGGTGSNAELFKISPSNYFCADLSLLGLQFVREKARGSAIQADGTKLPIRDHAVDAVLCSWSLEHFPNPEEIFHEKIRVVKSGGRIIIWGPNWDNIFRKDFPQFAHKSSSYVFNVRWKIFFKLYGTSFFPSGTSHLRRLMLWHLSTPTTSLTIPMRCTVFFARRQLSFSNNEG